MGNREGTVRCAGEVEVHWKREERRQLWRAPVSNMGGLGARFEEGEEGNGGGDRAL